MNKKLIFRICAAILAVSGLIILFSTLFPIFYYEWEASQKYPVLISPLVDEEDGSFTFSETDYTKASNWFESGNKENFSIQKVGFFTMSIPRLGIDNASVAIGSEDLSDSLIQYPGTAMPGKTGNTVIFGHSILPQYFDPANYLSIFSTLPKLEKYDEVTVSYDGIVYKYQVQNMFEVKPTDIQILEQSTDASYLTLVTCAPPGHPLKPRRLIVRAKLVPYGQASAHSNSQSGLD